MSPAKFYNIKTKITENTPRFHCYNFDSLKIFVCIALKNVIKKFSKNLIILLNQTHKIKLQKFCDAVLQYAILKNYKFKKLKSK